MAGRKFDPESLQEGLETLMGKAAEVFSKGREELFKQARAGKVKLIDLTQLRREKARLLMMMGEEVCTQLKAGKLEKEDLLRTYRRIGELDREIAAKEAEVERIQREGEAPSSRSGSQGTAGKADTGPKKAAEKAPQRPSETPSEASRSSKNRKKSLGGHDQDEDESE